MKSLRFWTLLAFVAFSVATPAAALQAPAGSNSLEPLSAAVPAAPADAPVIYVSDFDLDVVQRKPSAKPAAKRASSRRSNPPSDSRSSSGVPRAGPSHTPEPTNSQNTGADASDDSKEETPADQANTLVKAVSENIIRALTQAGFDARRLDVNAPPPRAGVRVRGVFAEADEMNRARRLLVGGEPTGGNLILYIGVNNLKSPEQPLYVLADPPANDPRHGPVITVTSYAPASRYELPRDPSGEELQKISKQIAADLSALVSANRLSIGQ